MTARPKNAAATREAILAAAHACFLKESYDSVGLRDIAGAAGVDVALIGRYFGCKEMLFREVIDRGEGVVLPPGFAASELPAFLTMMFEAHKEDEHREHAERLLIILRSASSPVAAGIVRDALCKDVLQPLAGCLEGEAPEARASFAMAVWMGTTLLRSIMAMEPLCNQNCEIMNAKLRALYETALAEV